MIRYAILGMIPLMMFPGCVGDDAGPGSSPLAAGMEQVSVADLQVLPQATPVVRGFVAGGSGCASLDAPVVAGNTVTIILTDYVATRDDIGISRSTCDVAVEIALPPGLTISLDDVTYRGFSEGSLARSTFFREYFFAGDFTGDRRFTVIDYDAAAKPTVIQNDSDAYTSNLGEFTALDRIRSARSGGTVVWRTNTALTVRNDFANSFALTSIDTVFVANRHFVTFRFGSPLNGN